jgi:translation initiation factor eIF-2B subunit delta
MDQGRGHSQLPIDPPVKVVGFHVEGASPSPRAGSTLRDALEQGGISPVIIPPTFQVRTMRRFVCSQQTISIFRRSFTAFPPWLLQGQRTPDVSPKRGPAPPEQPSTTAEGPVHPSPFASSAPAKVAGLQRSASSPPAPPSEIPKPLSPRPPASPKGSVSASLPPSKSPKAEQQKQKPKQKQAQPPPPQPQQQVEEAGGASRPKQKEMTKAERRALQEAQRAAKAAAKDNSTSSGAGKLPKTSSTGSLAAGKHGAVDRGTMATTSKKKAVEGDGAPETPTTAAAARTQTSSRVQKPTELFAHLPQYRSLPVEVVAERAAAASIPLECVRLGQRMADGTIRGANARCMAFFEMLSAAVSAFQPPPGRSFGREFVPLLNSMIAFLVSCRPLNPAMGNAVKAVKAELGRLNQDLSLSESDARSAVLSFLSAFVQEKLRYARVALAKRGASQLQDGDVVLTYSHSTAVESVLLAAAEAGTDFSVVVVDSRPLFEGRTLLRRLLAAGVPCEYVLLNAVELGLSQATKVAIGAAGVMSNGAVVSRVGTAAVAMAAAAAHVPVMVCAESYKFAERVQLDCITYNELGDPEALFEGAGAEGEALRQEWERNDNLSMLNLTYDATPAAFVSVIVTEVGALPPTSVPAVLREYRSEQQQHQ